MRVTRRDVLLCGTALALVPPAALAAEVLSGRAFGGTWRAVLPSGADDRRARRIIEQVIAQTDAEMSPWRGDSAISRFNRIADTRWRPLPSNTLRVVSEALATGRETGGAFDPRVGPVVARFGFGSVHPPQGDATGTVEIRAGQCRKTAPGVTLDLCGIAKGHALDRIMEALARAGHTEALVELGGEVRAAGRHPEGRDWRVAIERPGPGLVRAARIVAPGPLALATSGHAPNGHAGRAPLSHIVDPRTSRPARQSLLSVSVLAETAARADALATALTCLGATDGPALARKLGCSALFLLPDAGETEIITGDFARHILA